MIRPTNHSVASVYTYEWGPFLTGRSPQVHHICSELCRFGRLSVAWVLRAVLFCVLVPVLEPVL